MHYKFKLKIGKYVIKRKVYKADKIPWSNLPIRYGFIEISDFETIEYTCRRTEKPPKPNKNDVSIILMDIWLQLTKLILVMPFVSSIIP